MKCMVVYKAEFPNGKVYIGKTKNFEERKKSHYYSINRKRLTKVQGAILKYGFESIKWDILFKTDNYLLLNEKEIELINEFDSINNGYNISIGGDGGDTISNNERKEFIIRQQLKSKGIDNYIVIDDKISQCIKDDYIIGGLSIRSISKKYKISRQRLKRFFISNNITIDQDKGQKLNTLVFSDYFINKIIFLFNSGHSIKKISNIESLSIMIVSRILHDSGVRESKRFKNGKRYDGRQPKKRQPYNKVG